MGVYAAEIGYHTGSPLPGYPSGVAFFSSGAFVTGGTDTPPHTAFLPRITQPALLRRDVFDGGVCGASRVAYGELLLANPDGALDALLSWKIPGYSVTIRYGEPGTAYPSAWTTVLSGVSSGLTVGWKTLGIKLRDPHQTLDMPLQTVTYAGTNSGGSGIEGTADDLKGQAKPLLYGRVLNISPPCVNTSKLIYQVNDGAAVISAVYDKGIALTAGTACTSQADMEATVPSAGTYRVWASGGCFRLGSTPAGTITVDAAQTASTGDRSAAKLLNAIALKAGVASGSISSSDVTALHTANSAELGLWLMTGDTDTAKTAMDAIAVSVGAWYGFDAAGTLRMRQMVAPSGSPVMELTATNIIGTPELRAIGAASGGAFYTDVKCSYAKNWTVQGESDVAGAVTAARRAWLREEWRMKRPSVVVSDPGYRPELLYEFTGLFLSESDANTEALRRYTLLYGRHDTLVVAASASASVALDLGDVVQVTLPRFGYDAGVLFVVIGMQYDLRRNRIELTLWR